MHFFWLANANLSLPCNLQVKRRGVESVSQYKTKNNILAVVILAVLFRITKLQASLATCQCTLRAFIKPEPPTQSKVRPTSLHTLLHSSHSNRSSGKALTSISHRRQICLSTSWAFYASWLAKCLKKIFINNISNPKMLFKCQVEREWGRVYRCLIYHLDCACWPTNSLRNAARSRKVTRSWFN